MKKNYNIRKIKAKRSYTAEELAEVLNVHIQTVREWKRSGLNPLESNTSPHLFMGDTVKNFLKQKSQSRKTKLKVSEFYCLKCKGAVTPETVAKVDRGITLGKGKRSIVLQGFCPVCGTGVNKFATEPPASRDKPVKPPLEPNPNKKQENLTLFDI